MGVGKYKTTQGLAGHCWELHLYLKGRWEPLKISILWGRGGEDQIYFLEAFSDSHMEKQLELMF